MSLLEFIQKGGTINWVLAGTGILMMIISIERFIYFFQTRSDRKAILSEGRLSPVSQSGRMKELHRSSGNLSKKVRQDLFSRHSALILEEMERGLWIISFITAVAPSLGLLGTVSGLIKAFRQMAEAGAQVQIQSLSSGIWEAMLTTACGLLVAIPALFFSRFFRKIVDKRCLDMDLVLSVNDQENETEEELGNIDGMVRYAGF